METRLGSVQGWADSLGDEDWFRVDLMAGDSYLTACFSSERNGSLFVPAFEVLSEDGAVLAESTLDHDFQIDGLVDNAALGLSEDGDAVYLRFFDPAELAEGPGAWWRAEVYVAAEEVDVDETSCGLL